jgi:hypothetical protein
MPVRTLKRELQTRRQAPEFQTAKYQKREKGERCAAKLPSERKDGSVWFG